MNLVVLFSSLIFSTISCFIYKKVWSLFYLKQIATGYGYLLIYFILIYSYLLKSPPIDIKVFSFIFLFSSIYWIDDTKHISFILRLLIQFFCGLSIAFLILIENNVIYSYNFLIIIIFSGFLNIFLTNIVNFYDGLDLNISIFSIILSFVLIFLFSFEKNYEYLGLILLGFTLGFMLFNFIPNNIFFGDSGCFVISSIINFIIIKSVLSLDYGVAYLAIPFLFLIVDVGYVLLLRMYLKESLLTRNYHHIYHKLEKKYKNKIYLLPQIVCASGIFAVSIFVVPTDDISVIKFIMLSLILTLVLYFCIQFFTLRRN